MAMPQLINAVSLTQEQEESINKWLFEKIRSRIKGTVLEIGSGSGAFSSLFVEQGIPIIMTDPIKLNRDKLRETFREMAAVRYIDNIDFDHPNFQQLYSEMFRTIDTVVALNVVEKGFYTAQALNNAKQLVRARGRLIVITPCQTILFPGFEDNLKDLKEYIHKQLKELLGETELRKATYFSLRQHGIFPSSVSGPVFLLVLQKK
jgi:2-polyprenyl-3-methyl-5-hydroxy-6-metoxy-1,4-benzoquinol methylase